MAGYGEIPRGLDDLGVYPLDSLDEAGELVPVPGARNLSVNIESDSDQLEGDNQVIAVARNPKRVTGSIEIARMNLAALGALTGNEVSTDGDSPNEITTLEEAAGASNQYVQLIGQALSQDASGSAYRMTVPKALVVSGPDESMQVNEWSTPTIDFEGVALDDVLIIRQNFQTAADLPEND